MAKNRYIVRVVQKLAAGQPMTQLWLVERMTVGTHGRLYGGAPPEAAEKLIAMLAAAGCKVERFPAVIESEEQLCPAT